MQSTSSAVRSVTDTSPELWLALREAQHVHWWWRYVWALIEALQVHNGWTLREALPMHYG